MAHCCLQSCFLFDLLTFSCLLVLLTTNKYIHLSFDIFIINNKLL
nr:MAG TPA: hypothetical protein [Caudoviricetes sp.]